MAVYYPPAQPPPHSIHPSPYSHFLHHHQHNLPPQPPPPPIVLHPSRHAPHPLSLHGPPPPASLYPLSPLSLIDDVRTLFVARLPQDVKAREIYNLFHECPGYESSNLRCASKSNQPFTFAVFMDQHSAVAAMHALNAWAIAGVGSFHSPGMSSTSYNTIGCPSSQRFLKLKIQRTCGAPVAFVDFEVLALRIPVSMLYPPTRPFNIVAEKDTTSSSEALHQLQGAVPFSSPAGQGM